MLIKSGVTWMNTTKEQMNSLDERCEESLTSVQDAFATEFTIADNLLNYMVGKGDAYLIGGMKELIRAMRGVQEAVSLKIALNGTAHEIALEDAKKKQEGEKKGGSE